MAKSAKKSESIAYVTPWFTARYPKISKPDTEGKFADGKFKTDGILDEDDIEAVRKALTAAGKQFFPSVDEDEIRLPLKEFFNGRKDEEKTSAGWGITLKSQYRPAVFDAKKKKLPEGSVIGGGSELRVASAIFPWSKAEKQTIIEGGKKRTADVTAYGVGLRLGDVQVRKLCISSGQGDGAAFDEVEGFEFDGEGDEGSSQFDSATDL
jgi:hypothetical protein